jgi:hypothetical protein
MWPIVQGVAEQVNLSRTKPAARASMILPAVAKAKVGVASQQVISLPGVDLLYPPIQGSLNRQGQIVALPFPPSFALISAESPEPRTESSRICGASFALQPRCVQYDQRAIHPNYGVAK